MIKFQCERSKDIINSGKPLVANLPGPKKIPISLFIQSGNLVLKKIEKGGLSGEPIKKISTKMIKKFYKEIDKKIPIIGVGGVDSGQSAFEKITAGADAVQLYTGMVYKGPGIVKEIKKELISILKKENLKNISEAVGINA